MQPVGTQEFRDTLVFEDARGPRVLRIRVEPGAQKAHQLHVESHGTPQEEPMARGPFAPLAYGIPKVPVIQYIGVPGREGFHMAYHVVLEPERGRMLQRRELRVSDGQQFTSFPWLELQPESVVPLKVYSARWLFLSTPVGLRTKWPIHYGRAS